MRRVCLDHETYLLSHFATQCAKRRLAWFDPSAGSRPHDCPRRVWDRKSAQEDAVVFVEDDRAN